MYMSQKANNVYNIFHEYYLEIETTNENVKRLQ